MQRLSGQSQWWLWSGQRWVVFVENFLAAGVAGITAMYVFFFFLGGGC